MHNNTKKTAYSQVIFLSILLSFLGASQIEASSAKQTIKEGNLLYEQGDYIASEKKYREALEKDTESDIINFNLGAVLYKEEEYEEAMDHFQKVYLSEDDQLKQKAYYNSGNALYRTGIFQEQEGSVAAAIPFIEQSLKQYERAIEIDEDDEDTKHNYTFVQKELKRLEEIQKQQQQKGGQGEDSEDSEQSENQDQQQDQQQGQQPQNSQGQEGQEDQQQQDSQGQQQEQGDEQENQQQGSDQKQGQESGEEDNSQQNTGTAAQSTSELTAQEALMMLERYQQTEEPQEPLNMQPKVNNSGPVVNDW